MSECKQDIAVENARWKADLLRRIDAGERLSEEDIGEIVNALEEVDSETFESGRWTESVRTVVNLCGRFFAIEWERGLTECQDNEFPNQPFEVERHEYQKTITVVKWKMVRKPGSPT